MLYLVQVAAMVPGSSKAGVKADSLFDTCEKAATEGKKLSAYSRLLLSEHHLRGKSAF